MQKIVIEKPYRFRPPNRGTFWSTLSQRFNLHGLYLRLFEGVVSHESRGVECLRQSLDAQHGIIITPNHCRDADPMVVGFLTQEAHCHFYFMASWHLYHQSCFKSWAIPKVGGFSINREGVDRQSVEFAVEAVATAERPVIVFPEGAMTRTNDHLHALLDGVEVMARAAARRRARQVSGGKVVVHPVAIKYFFGGDLAAAVDPVLTAIEARFGWRPQRHLSLLDRIEKTATALLCLREIALFGEPQAGDVPERNRRLIEKLLRPLEEEWLGAAQSGPVVPRVKELRLKIVPDLVTGQISPEERRRRWDQLADIYLAQQISCYPDHYLRSWPSVDRLLETVERFEDDLTDRARIHGSLKAVIQVGQAIEVDTRRDRRGESLVQRIARDLQNMLDQLARESPLIEQPTAPTPDSSEFPAHASGW